MIEANVEGEVTKWAEANGFLSRKMKYIGRHGCRDRDFYGHGHVVLIEFKRPGKTAAAHQERERRRLAEVGVTIHVIDDIDAGIAVLKRAVANPRRGDALA